jgi:uncharacterized caspase-like protein
MSGRYALLIGNSRFDDPALARLSAPEADVAALQAVLKDPRIAGFETRLLLNEDLAAVRSAVVEHFRDRYRDDVVLLYYSGHGLRDDHGDLYFALPGTRASTPDGLSLGAGFVRRQMDKSHSERQVLILDCCHSGAFMRPGTRRSAVDSNLRRDDFDPSGHGRFVLAAAKANESAFEENGRSIYTRHLVAALGGAAAAPGREGITVHDVHEYVRRQVKGHRAPMQPVLWADQQTDPLVIARSPSPGVVLPAEPLWASLRRASGRLLDGRSKADIRTIIAVPALALLVLLYLALNGTDPPGRSGQTLGSSPPSEEPAAELQPAIDLIEANDRAPAAADEGGIIAPETPKVHTGESVAQPDRPPPVHSGPSRAEIRQVQEQLRRLGFNPGPIDGLWGGRSSEALSVYLREEGLGGRATVERAVELLPRLRAETTPPAPPPTVTFAPAPVPWPNLQPPPSTVCRVRVIHRYWKLHESPSNSSAAIGTVPQATYFVQSQRRVSWAGRYDWWFRITADGRNGWIRASAPFVEALGDDCFR